MQGSDLVVRDGLLHLRVPGRLEQVDVVLRRVDALWSDPLELRGDSRLGVAGLTETVRRGHARVVNGLGAGVLENPALLPFLPAACEALLGEPLRLPSMPTWWCGDPASRQRVLDGLADGEPVVVREIDAPLGSLAALDPAALAERVRAAPHRFVGQRLPQLSTSPTWSPGRPGLPGLPGVEGRATPQPVTLRTFTVRYGSSFRSLMGGLASVLDGDRVARSKDVWVLKADPADPDQQLPQVLPVTATRSVTGAVPRVLEDMYWYGRYAERAEDLLRLVLAAHTLAEDFVDRPRTTGAIALEVMMGATSRFAGRSRVDLDGEFRSLLLDSTREGSVAQSVAGLRGALSGVRDQLSTDAWRALGAFDRAGEALLAATHSHQVAESAGRMLTGALALQGVSASMIRDESWHMTAAGRALERCVQLVHLLAATVTTRRGLEVDRVVMDAVLASAESAVTHRRRYRGSTRIGGVLELLLLDADNPRSLAFNLAAASEHLGAQLASTGSTRPERLLQDLRAEVEATDVAELVAIGGEGRPHLVRFLTGLLAQLARIDVAVHALHLTSGPAPTPFATLGAPAGGPGPREVAGRPR